MGTARQAIDRHRHAQKTWEAGAIAHRPASMRICSTPIAPQQSCIFLPFFVHHLDGCRNREEDEIDLQLCQNCEVDSVSVYLSVSVRGSPQRVKLVG